MATPISLKRLKREYLKLLNNPPPFIIAKPLESNILEWHYIITGPPDTPYHNGEYHGVLLFPPEYPYKPPAIKMMTPNGRFKTDFRLCLSISDYHPKNWSAAWSVSTILTGLLSFMLEDTKTLGSIISTKEEKIFLSKKTKEYNRKDPKFRLVFPELCDDLDQSILQENSNESNKNIKEQNLPIETNNENNEGKIALIENENNEEQIEPIENENNKEEYAIIGNENNDENNNDNNPENNTEQIKPKINTKKVRIIEPEINNQKIKRKSKSKNNCIVIPGTERSTLELKLIRHRIREFPLEIIHLINLRRLNLNVNFLTGLPYNITSLTNLRYLNLSDNYLKEFPLPLCHMRKLEILDISKNEIEKLPEDFGRLQDTLEGIDISNNRLKRIPYYIGKMTRLYVLNIG